MHLTDQNVADQLVSLEEWMRSTDFQRQQRDDIMYLVQIFRSAREKISAREFERLREEVKHKWHIKKGDFDIALKLLSQEDHK